MVKRLRVEDLADRADAARVQVRLEAGDEAERVLRAQDARARRRRKDRWSQLHTVPWW